MCLMCVCFQYALVNIRLYKTGCNSPPLGETNEDVLSNYYDIPEVVF